MKLLSPLFIAFLLLVSSCTSKTDKAQEIVRDFSKALSNVDSIAIKKNLSIICVFLQFISYHG